MANELAGKLLSEARQALEAARAELKEAVSEGDAVKLRKACEAAWLAVVRAVDALLASSGLGPGESHRDRRNKLRKLEVSRPEVAGLGLRDRYMARMGYLHIDGFYEGTLGPEEAEEQLDKAEALLADVERLIPRLSEERLSTSPAQGASGAPMGS